MRVAVLVTDTLPEEAKTLLSNFEVREKEADDEFLGKVQALICWPPRAKPELLRKMTNLKMVQTLTAGVDVLDFRDLPPDAQVYSNAGAFTENVAEHVWGLLLGVAKGLHVRNQKTIPRRLRRKNLLVVGAGSIGSEVARLSKSMEMTTIGVSRSFKSPELFDEVYPLAKLPEVIPRADAVAVSLPLTNKTRGIFDHDLLMKTKEAVLVVNVGRGETFDEQGLIAWLSERPESRYVTDVFWFKDGRESFATKAWDLPNFAGTLHDSGLPLGEDLSSVKVAAAWNVRRYFETGNAVNHVDISEYL